MAEKVQIVFQPSGRRGEIEAGKSILAAARELGVGIEAACGGDPAESAEACKEARKRSPLTWLPNAVNRLPVDIGTGIHDGHRGSVPVGQAIRAYNTLAAPEDRISEEDIVRIEAEEKIPDHLKAGSGDPAYGSHTVYLRKQSNLARLTLFEGGHDMIADAAFEWLSRQAAGQTPNFTPGRPPAVEREANLDR